MANVKNALKPLQVGDRIWLQINTAFYESEERFERMEVVKANKTSAYLAYADRKPDSTLTYRVEQKTRIVHAPYSPGYRFKVWMKKEDYEYHNQKKKEKVDYREQAFEKIRKMSLDELKKFVEEK